MQNSAHELLYLLSWCCRSAELKGPADLRVFAISDRVMKRSRELVAELGGEVNMRYLNPDFTPKVND